MKAKTALRFAFLVVAATVGLSSARADCSKLGCPDCSCVVLRRQLAEKLPDLFLQINQTLKANGIPPNTVTISINSRRGVNRTLATELPNRTIVRGRCNKQSNRCTWMFPTD